MDNFYFDAIYYRNNKLTVDMEYLGWLKWEENYNLDYQSYDFSKNNLNNLNNLNLPNKFDLRNADSKNYTTSVKNQGSTGNCWAFSSTAALESHILKNGGFSYDLSTNLDFSENNLKNIMSSRGELGTDYIVNGGGTMFMPIAYYLRWSGPVNEVDDMYISDNPLEDLKPVKHVQGIGYLYPRNNYLDNDALKQAIYNYGGVVTSLYWNNNFENNGNYYYPLNSLNGGERHSVCVIGWDDNYTRDNFKYQTAGMGDGAFIIKNSWGSNHGKNGYDYISYYDTQFAIKNDLGFSGFYFTNVENNTNYGSNYFYNPLGINYWLQVNDSEVKFYNQWVANKDESIESCGLYVLVPSLCNITVFVDNEQKGITNAVLYSPGYHTIKLNEIIDVKKNHNFKIEITLSGYSSYYVPLEMKRVTYSKVTSKPNQSFVRMKKNNSYEWVDMNSLNSSNICLNVYTKYKEVIDTNIQANDLKIIDGENKNLQAVLNDINGNRLQNYDLTFYVDGVEYTKVHDNNGIVSLPFKLSIGEYTVSIHYYGDDSYAYSRKTVKIIVIPKELKPTVIQIGKVSVGDGDVKITLKSGSNLLNGKSVLIDMGGKQYKRVSNNGNIILKKSIKKVMKIKVKFNGDNEYKSSQSSITVAKRQVKINGLNPNYKKNAECKLNLLNKDNKKIKSKLKLTIKSNNKKFTFKDSNNDGVISFSLKKFKFKENNKYTISYSFPSAYSKNNVLFGSVKDSIKIKK